MELQLGKQKRMMYARVFDRTEEETCSADAVVPDALGDIGAIVVTEGTFCLWNLDFSDKSAQIEGSIVADVVYAEESGALRSFPVELPVKVRISGETLSPDVRPWLRCTLTALDARAVNSRKVRVTARLSLCLRAYRETELALTDRIEGDGGTVFTRTETLRVQVPVSVEEKTFTVSETHRFTAGQPEADRLLCHTETVLLDDVSTVGSRVILQGRVCAAVSYLQQGAAVPNGRDLRDAVFANARLPGGHVAVPAAHDRQSHSGLPECERRSRRGGTGGGVSSRCADGVPCGYGG